MKVEIPTTLISPESYAQLAQAEALNTQTTGKPIADRDVRGLMARLIEMNAIIEPEFQALFNRAATRSHTKTSSGNKGGRTPGNLGYDPRQVVRDYYDLIDGGKSSALAKDELAGRYHKDVSRIAEVLREYSEWPCSEEVGPVAAARGELERIADEYGIPPGVPVQLIEHEGCEKNNGEKYKRVTQRLANGEPITVSTGSGYAVRSRAQQARDQDRRSRKMLLDAEKRLVSASGKAVSSK